jgi:hypothetical protein
MFPQNIEEAGVHRHHGPVHCRFQPGPPAVPPTQADDADTDTSADSNASTVPFETID